MFSQQVLAADAPLTIERLMADIGRSTQAEVRFRETKYSSLLKAPLESSGVLRFKPPGFLEKRVQEPFEERFTVDGEQVTIERRGKDANTRGQPITIQLASQPMLRAFIEGLRGFLRGDLAALKRHYRVDFEGSAGGWMVSLLPAEVDMGEFIRAIRISGRDARMQSIEVHEASGDRSVLRVIDDKRS